MFNICANVLIKSSCWNSNNFTKEKQLKMSSAKWRPFCVADNIYTGLSRAMLYNATPSVRFRSRMAFVDGLIGIITSRIDACWG